jgi:MFS family permease
VGVVKKFKAWLPVLSLPVWLMVGGRLFSQTGTGFTLFYAPIFFVDQVGLSATQVGLGLGAMSLTGIAGRILSGSLVDGQMGRKPTLLISLVFSGLGSLILAGANGFSLFLVGNLVAGIGLGLYWPAAEALVADLTTRAERNEAFALNRLGDNLGLSLGVVMASIWVELTGSYRALFVIDAISYGIFFVLVLFLIRESRAATTGDERTGWAGWRVALTDRSLMVFGLANIFLTTYIAQVSAGLPLYFDKFIGLPLQTIGRLFFLHGLLIAVMQIPVARFLNRLPRIQGLMVSCAAWGIGFGLIWLTGVSGVDFTGTGINWSGIIGSGGALALLSLAIVAYNPAASSLVVDLAPMDLRGVYFSLNSLCWAAGFAVGPLVSGVVLDQPAPVAHQLWLGWSLSVGLVVAILAYLGRILPNTQQGRAEAP